MIRSLIFAVAFAATSIIPHAKFIEEEWPKNLPDTTKQWFKSQRSKGGGFCCDIADGHPTEWAIDANGTFYASVDGAMREVPPDRVILGQRNPTGRAVVWLDSSKNIRCFIPGPQI